MAVNEAKLQEFMGKALGDMAAGMSAVLVLIGDKLGLYKALAQSGPVTTSEFAQCTGCAERYLREWLANQAAGGYVTYDAATKKYRLMEEQAMALAEENSPAFIPGIFHTMSAVFKDEPKITERFRTGQGLPWGDHDKSLFEGTERFFRPYYNANLVSAWIPALDGVEVKLKKGGRVADVGCGYGASTILMAKAYPQSEFIGFDAHPASIETARRRAQEAGMNGRVKFEVAKSTDYPGKDYDFVAHFDCLHDMGDPVGAARHVFETLKKDGSWMIVEPFAHDRVEENLNPIGRLFYAASTMICVPASLAYNGPALGAQAGETRLREIINQGGFKKIRLATQTPFNLILEAKAG
jgi:2-polyprenyl-3-methyl-5-hydroxy-6-metoxy-1,4-benzoquinol methylase